MRTALVTVLGLLCGSALAKPMGVVVDREFDDALLVAEVTVESVTPAAWGGQNGKPGAVRVKVTSDPDRIFRGFEHLGRTMDLVPHSGGAMSATTSLDDFRKKGKAALLFVRRDGTMICCAGEIAVDKQRAYKLHGWCDYNACFFHSIDKTFGKGDAKFAEGFTLTAAEMAKRGAAQRTAFVSKAAELLGDPPALIAADEFAGIVKRFASETFADREAAERDLVTRGRYQIGAIKSAAEKATDTEVRSRLESVLEKLGDYTVAADFAIHVRKLGALPEARMLVEGAAHLDGAAKARAVGRLRALAKQEGVTIDGAGDDAVIAAWRARAAR